MIFTGTAPIIHSYSANYTQEGYIYPTPSSILPYLEHPSSGPTFNFCAAQAKRLKCYVIAGCPLLLPSLVTQGTNDSDTRNHPVGSNSALLVSPLGDLVTTYNKTHMYTSDLPWCSPGSGFLTLRLPPPLGKVTIAICMDLNPSPPSSWSSLEDGPYELAEYVKKEVKVFSLEPLSSKQSNASLLGQ